MLLSEHVSGRRHRFIFKCIRNKNNFFVIHYLKQTNNVYLIDEYRDNIFINILKYGTNDMLTFFMNKYPHYDLDQFDHDGVHSYFYLINRTDLDVNYVRSFFIRCNRDINIWSERYGSLLHHSVYMRNIFAFNLLISMGANVNSYDKDRNPLIFYCVLNGLIEISNLLINHEDFDVNLVNHENESILEIAIIKYMPLHAKLLLTKNPDVIKNKNIMLRLMDHSIESRNTLMAWQLYQHHCAYIIQKAFRCSRN